MGTLLPSPHFRLLLRWQLGAPLLPLGVQLPPCPACGDPIDPFGDHFVCCNHNGAMRRHDAVKLAVAQVLRSAGISHLLEQGPRLASSQRPADILLCRWSAGRDTAVDLVVAHPLAKSQHPLTPLKARRFTQAQESAKVTEADKSAELRAAGWAFLPMGFNTFAAPGPQRLPAAPGNFPAGNGGP